jgi:hypothetical protein
MYDWISLDRNRSSTSCRFGIYIDTDSHQKVQAHSRVHTSKKVSIIWLSYDSSFRRANFRNLRTSRAQLLLPYLKQRLGTDTFDLNLKLWFVYFVLLKYICDQQCLLLRRRLTTYWDKFASTNAPKSDSKLPFYSPNTINRAYLPLKCQLT